MKRIESVAEYKALITQAKESGFTLSNCFFLPTVVQQKIDQGILLALPIKNGLLILEDMADFYRCFYYLSPNGELENVVLDKATVIEFPFNEKMTEKQLLQIEKIYAMGFVLGRESSQMTLDKENVGVEELPSIHYELCTAHRSDTEAILDMLNMAFDKLYAFIPTKEELNAIIEENRIWVLRCQGKIAALLHSSFQKGQATIEHIVVTEQYRGQGLGAYLLKNYHNYYFDMAKGFCHWVDIHNESAVKLYSAFGYSFGIKKANEYIKR